MVAPDFDAQPRHMPNDTGRRVAKELIGMPDNQAAHAFALRWSIFDIVVRIVILVGIAIVPVLTTYNLDAKVKSTAEQLKEHINRSVQIAKTPGDFATKEAAVEISRHYASLARLTQDYVDEAEVLGKVQIASICLPLILLIVMGIGEYYRFKAVVQLKKAMSFLRSDEGQQQLRQPRPE